MKSIKQTQPKQHIINGLLQRADIWQASYTKPQNPSIPTGYDILDKQLHNNGWPTSAITELLINGHGIGEMRLLVPALARLSQQRQWIAFIAPPHIPYAPALIERGVDTSHILVIRPKNQQDQLWATEQALRSQTCSAVLTWFTSTPWVKQYEHKKHEHQKYKCKNDGLPADKSHAQRSTQYHKSHSWKTNTTLTDLRRLQLAAQQGHCLGILFRSASLVQQASPARLRIQLSYGQQTSLSGSYLQLNIIKQQGSWHRQTLQLRMEGHLEQPRLTANDLPIHQATDHEAKITPYRKNDMAANNDTISPLQ